MSIDPFLFALFLIIVAWGSVWGLALGTRQVRRKAFLLRGWVQITFISIFATLEIALAVSWFVLDPSAGSLTFFGAGIGTFIGMENITGTILIYNLSSQGVHDVLQETLHGLGIEGTVNGEDSIGVPALKGKIEVRDHKWNAYAQVFLRFQEDREVIERIIQSLHRVLPSKSLGRVSRGGLTTLIAIAFLLALTAVIIKLAFPS